jgi:cell division protein FtsI/penicillin-binding protein 2
MKGNENLRINIIFACVLLFAGLIVYRLFVLGYVDHSNYLRTAEAQKNQINNLLVRGNIYFQDPKRIGAEGETNKYYLAATNKKFPLLQINLNLVDEEQKVNIIQKLSEIDGLDKEKISKAINSDGSYRIIQRRLSNDQVEKIKNLGIKGLSVVYETDRYYPNDSLAADVLGFLGYNSEGRSGQYGVESKYNSWLFGEERTDSKMEEEPNGLWPSIKNWFVGDSEDKKDNEIKRPSDIILTIDKNIQSFVEDELSNLIKKYEAERGTIIVQDPNSGKILAMADKPSFNPNQYGEYDTKLFLNSSVQEFFEPGSSFKPVTMAAGLDLSKITPQTFFTDVGFVEIADYKIKNFSERIFGRINMAQVLEKSVNTGTMFVENQIGDENFLNYVINMGFGQITGIDLPGEIPGDVSNLYSGRKINFLTASFGQGIAVTPIQLINAYSAIANGGKLMKPYLVEKIIKENGEEITIQPSINSIPISEKTATKLKTMLVGVVDNGFDKARIKGYDVAGKTGTAQISDGKGGYLENEYIHNFLGFAPAYDSKFVVLIKIDKPKGVTFASDSLSPTYREIVNYLINYYGIPPTRK